MQAPRIPAQTWWDVAVAVTIGAAVAASAALSLSNPHPTATVTFCGLAACVVLLGRSRQPIPTLLLVSVLAVLPTLLTATFPDFYASFATSLAAIYAVAVRCSTRQSAVVPIVGAGILVCFAARVPSFLTAAQLLYTVTGIVLAFGAGRTMRLLRTRADVESARADLLVREHDVQAREAVAAERERIARELHDVIAHDVAVMVVQAGAAERVLHVDSNQVGDSLAQIQSSGRKAIDELHLLLGMLREDEQALVIRPGLSGVDTLVDELTSAGLHVSLEVRGEVRDLSEALDVSAYRVVQEGLTNVLKHAPGSTTRVLIDYGNNAVTIAVADDGDGRSVAADLPASGHGLAGMRERVRLFGGTLAAGARPLGGWEITATLPIGPS